MQIKPKVLVITGYGINCEEEIAYSFNTTGGEAEVIHINDLIENPKKLDNTQILAFPGGFSYGDDTGSGNAMANKIRNNIFEELLKFIQRDTLTIGICNGFQIITNLGLVPATDGNYGKTEAVLMHNKQARYECRWIHIKNTSKKCVWTQNIDLLHVPIAHGEGNFYTPEETFQKLKQNDQIVFRYTNPDGSAANGLFPSNPNGAMDDIAAICDESGRIMGMMPHPERFNSFYNEYDWPEKKEKLLRNNQQIDTTGEGLIIFKNGINYFL